MKPAFDWSSEPIPVAVRPNSNTPLMLSAKMSMAAASPKTNVGDCSWNPPAELAAAGPKDREQAREEPERDEDARREHDSVERHLPSVRPSMVSRTRGS